MKWLRTGSILLLVAFWLPVSMHCRLGQLPALQFLACCDHSGGAPHEDEDCNLDGCDVIESGLYRAGDQLRFEPDRACTAATRIEAVTDCLRRPPARTQLPRALAPPELEAGWRFALRTALSPRAPSLPS